MAQDMPIASPVWDTLSAEDHQRIRRLYTVRDAATPPVQSNFRVAAVFAFTDTDGQPQLLDGTNNETCYIHGSICAERSTLPRIRQMGYNSIDAGYITCDGKGYITPGMLCREYMTEVAGLDLRLVLVSGATVPSPEGPVPCEINITTVGELYPFPPVYRCISRYEVLNAAEALSAAVAPWWAGSLSVDSDDSDDDDGSDAQGIEARLGSVAAASGVATSDVYRMLKAIHAETARDNRDILHPIRYAAGALFDDGSIVTGCETKALEYGATINPVIKIAKALEDAHDAGRKVLLLAVMDQYGVLHGPFADSRAFLHEGPWGAVPVVVHNSEGDGALVVTAASDLIPDSPRIEELFANVDEARARADATSPATSPDGKVHKPKTSHRPGSRTTTLHNILA
ncbi:uncharacterized protein AMSG_06701 [Thecamonas trahens ATCC 50062]|uniref:Uncharacterized protein n=1 Tax=Thecamonas trahens ATCC 50062 TaxID=461836 RepID=A0A0L0DEZ7_THETB|nr:hypothetical protein AMSG_06701 [Thecamonas trahens ATCC 50062]KNC50800.1 hypothetical protein AMSG_06701 [Thecamonas trahens ATCC 50062]|eukprot:XP_013756756.1 hypothetical protein AMSG_06701 [Thecamonas trahens ATCC 50062]